jgi:hypothetical protein
LEGGLQKFEELSYFDNMALLYVCRETPPHTLALVFLAGDAKIAGSMLGLLDKKRREYVHSLMVQNKDISEETKKDALSGILLIAENLMSRNLIQKEGQFYFGKQTNPK